MRDFFLRQEEGLLCLKACLFFAALSAGVIQDIMSHLSCLYLLGITQMRCQETVCKRFQHSFCIPWGSLNLSANIFCTQFTLGLYDCDFIKIKNREHHFASRGMQTKRNEDIHSPWHRKAGHSSSILCYVQDKILIKDVYPWLSCVVFDCFNHPLWSLTLTQTTDLQSYPHSCHSGRVTALIACFSVFYWISLMWIPHIIYELSNKSPAV